MRKSAQYGFIFLVLSLLSFGFSSKVILEEPVQVVHIHENQNHFLIFPNLLTIPKDNYAKLFNRLKTMYPEIKEILYQETQEYFRLCFSSKFPSHERITEILSKFSVRIFRIKES